MPDDVTGFKVIFDQHDVQQAARGGTVRHISRFDGC